MTYHRIGNDEHMFALAMGVLRSFFQEHVHNCHALGMGRVFDIQILARTYYPSRQEQRSHVHHLCLNYMDRHTVLIGDLMCIINRRLVNL